MRRGFLDCLCCFLRFLRSLQIHTPFLFVKRLFLAVVFSAQTALKKTPPPPNSSTLKLSLSLL
ncbi:hypothetical protein AB991_07040 [Helicobacter pylori]|nr:hypothetical protein AB991_07040 [Helicobacter pylori]